MKPTEIKCPNCGGDINLSYSGRTTCPYCDSTFFVEEKRGNIIINTTINHYGNESFASSAGKREKAGSFLLAFFLFIALGTGIFAMRKVIPSSPDGDSVSPSSYCKTVTSERMIRFARIVFGKNVEELGESDFASVTFLRFMKDGEISDRDFRILYKRNDGELKEVKFTEPFFSGEKIPLHDFQCFVNLKVLDFNDSDVVLRSFSGDESGYAKDFKNLTKLQEYGSPEFGLLTDLPEILSDVSALRYASGSLYEKKDMDAFFTQFSNLLQLKINNVDDKAVSKLSALSALKNLKKLEMPSLPDNNHLAGLPALTELSLHGNSERNDVDALYGLPKLKKLTLESFSDLKDLSFVSAMPSLSSLHILHSEVKDILPLEGNPNIKELSLVSNPKIRDYSPIASLTALKDLTLTAWHFDAGTVMPKLSGLTNLTTLSANHDKLSVLSVPQSVKKLQIDTRLAETFDLSELPPLKKVKDLSFTGEGYLKNAQGLKKLPALLRLSFDKTRLSYFDFSEVLNLPSLKEVRAVDVSALGINPKAVRKNQTLEVLRIEKTDRLSLLEGGVKERNATLGDITETFANFSALRHLTLTDGSIDDLSFVTGLPLLQTVDFSRNYIKDISPLTKLSKLETAVLQDNPVANGALLKGKTDLP